MNLRQLPSLLLPSQTRQTRSRPAVSRPALMRARRLLNTVNLTTPAGLALARAGRCRVTRGPDGLLLAEGWSWVLPKAAAFTVGNVILYRSRVAPSFRPGRGGTRGQDSVEASSPLLRHEARHSSQYAALGLLFWPLYFLAAVVSLLRKGDPASGNVFEQLAGLHDGGYRRPARSSLPHPLPHPIPHPRWQKV